MINLSDVSTAIRSVINHADFEQALFEERAERALSRVGNNPNTYQTICAARLFAEDDYIIPIVRGRLVNIIGDDDRSYQRCSKAAKDWGSTPKRDDHGNENILYGQAFPWNRYYTEQAEKYLAKRNLHQMWLNILDNHGLDALVEDQKAYQPANTRAHV